MFTSQSMALSVSIRFLTFLIRLVHGLQTLRIVSVIALVVGTALASTHLTSPSLLAHTVTSTSEFFLSHSLSTSNI